MYVSVCVCVCICIYVYVYVCIYISIFLFLNYTGHQCKTVTLLTDLSCINIFIYSVISKSGSIYGLSQLGLRSYPSGTFTPETMSLLRSDKPVYTTTSVRPAGPWQPTSAVAGPIFSNRYLHPTFTHGFHNFFGRFYARVGRPYGGFPNLRHLSPFGSPAPYQLFGAQGGSCCPTPLGFSAPGPPGFDRYGQHYSSFLYQQTLRDPFPNLVASSSASLLCGCRLRT